MTVSKLLNQRCFIRWSADRASRAIFPAVQLGKETAAGLMEALERVSPALQIESLRAAADRVGVFLHAFIVDSLPANGKLFQMWAAAVPRALHWKMRCDSHACASITGRPLDARGLFDAMFCLQRLLGTQDVRDRLQRRMVQMAVEDVRGGGTRVGAPPPRGAAAAQLPLRARGASSARPVRAAPAPALARPP